MNLVAPAPNVESVVVEPVHPDSQSIRVECPRDVGEAEAAPPLPVEPAETVDNPHKFAPSNVLVSHEKSKIDVETLRNRGIDFESRVGVVKDGAPRKNFFQIYFPLCCSSRYFLSFSEIARYAVIQGNCCFIFLESTDACPLYGFSLHDVTAELENRDRPDPYSCTVNPCSNSNRTGEGLETVLLRYNTNGSLAYQFTFEVSNDRTVVKRFLEAVQRATRRVVDGRAAVMATEGKGTKT